jgi:chitinase
LLTTTRALQKNLAIYWGQNSAGTPPTKVSEGPQLAEKYWQGPLSTYCDDGDIDIIILAFITNLEGPVFNFANQQGGACNTGSTPVVCEQIGKDIKTCQDKRKTILLSIGGSPSATKNYTTKEGAEAGATKIWDMFGPTLSTDLTNRPFGKSFVNGFDFDLEQEVGHIESFAKTLRDLGDKAGGSLLSAAPECQFPKNAALINSGGLDMWFVQFYNNPQCDIDAGNINGSLTLWNTWAKGYKIKFFAGLPVSNRSAPAGGYIAQEKLKEDFAGKKDLRDMAGAMLWDVS